MTPLHIYLITRLEAVNLALVSIFIVSLVALLFTAISWLDSWGEKEAGSAFKRSIIIMIISTLLMVLIPTKNEAIAIYVIPKIANNEQIQSIPPKLLELVDIKLDELIEQGTDENRNN